MSLNMNAKAVAKLIDAVVGVFPPTTLAEAP
jgi:hypothetical protein